MDQTKCSVLGRGYYIGIRLFGTTGNVFDFSCITMVVSFFNHAPEDLFTEACIGPHYITNH